METYLEGTSVAPEIKEFLDKEAVEPELLVSPGTIFPRPGRWHVPLTGRVLDAMLAFSARHAEPEVCDHVAVYAAGRVVLMAHDAGSSDVLVSADLPAELLAELRLRLSPADAGR